MGLCVTSASKNQASLSAELKRKKELQIGTRALWLQGSGSYQSISPVEGLNPVVENVKEKWDHPTTFIKCFNFYSWK